MSHSWLEDGFEGPDACQSMVDYLFFFFPNVILRFLTWTTTSLGVLHVLGPKKKWQCHANLSEASIPHGHKFFDVPDMNFLISYTILYYIILSYYTIILSYTILYYIILSYYTILYYHTRLYHISFHTFFVFIPQPVISGKPWRRGELDLHLRNTVTNSHGKLRQKRRAGSLVICYVMGRFNGI